MRKALKLVAPPALSRLLLIFLALILFNSAMAQTRTGTVSGPDGKGIPGITVQVKGSTIATSTNASGHYSIDAPNNAVLIFTSVGFTPQEITVGTSTVINTALVSASSNLNEVVVTALGIRKEARRLGYSSTTVNSENLTVNRTVNVGNSLQGKVAGLNVTPPAGGPGGSTKIRLRGQSSFGANNSPLIVLNGVPIDNSSVSATKSGDGSTGNPTPGSSDQGDGLQSINQDDIETMTVLKGSAASALYGSRAKDGAIIITTKTGKGTNGIGVEINSNFQFAEALDYTDFQYDYGQGENGIRPKTVSDAQSSGVFSFGEKFDGKPTPQFDGSSQPYVAYKNRIKDYYQNATSFSNTVALSGGSDKGYFRLSFNNTDANALIPNSDYHKMILNFNTTYKFTDKFMMQFSANYSNERNRNPPQIGLQDMNANTTIYTMANSIDVAWLKNTYKDANGNEQPLSRFTNRNNPYWVAYQRAELVKRDRIFGNVLLRYQLLPWLYVQGRYGMDYFTRPYNYNIPTGTRSAPAAPTTTAFNGSYYQQTATNREVNMDFMLGANKTFGNGKFGIDALLGGAQQRFTYDAIGANVTNFYIRDLYTIGNGITKSPYYNYSKRQVNSVYGSAELSYNSLLYLTVTARNDWFSTLNPESNSYLYPSVSLSYVFTQSIKTLPSWLNFGKLRASYAEVGGGAQDAYANNLYFAVNPNQFTGNQGNAVGLGNIVGTVAPNPNLSPSAVKEFELGLETRMFNNRLNLDVAVYQKKTIDDILNVDISNSSGFSQTKVNLGELENKGIEILLTAVPVKTKSVTWESSFNTAYNESKVLSLAEGQQRFDGGSGEFFGNVSYEVGMPLGSLRGFDYQRDAKGQIITKSGLFQQGNIITFGSAIPKWTGGWLNTVTVKGIKIFVQFDYKADYIIMSNSNLNFLRHGLSQQSLEGREGGVLFPGVNTDGSPNTTKVEAQAFYTQYRSTSIANPFVYKGDFIRWRALSVGYDFSRFFKNSFIKGLNVSANCFNVLMISKHIDNLDPEASVSASDNFQGIETHTLPTTRSYGLNVNIKL